MIEAFSYAKEYWAVGLCVKASNLESVRPDCLSPESYVPSMPDVPCEADLDVVLVHWESQIEQLQLAVVSVQ